MTITKTNLQIINFINFARTYLSQHKERTKFRYALERMEPRATKMHEKFAEDARDLNIENAAVDEKGVMLMEGDKFRFTKDGLRARDKAQRELLEKTVELEAYHATELPDNLTEDEKIAASGFVMPEIEQPQENAE